MKINVKKIRRMAMLLGLLMMLSVVLAACVNLDEVSEVDRDDVLGDTSFADDNSSEVELSTPEGATDAPVVTDIVNIAPYTVAISGTCEDGATIRVTGGEEDVETVANGGYFIIEADLIYQNNLLKVTAQVEGKDISLEREVIASHNATADTLLDGNSVSVGANSRLYFDKMVADASGDNLYTTSQLKDIQNYVNDTVTSYYQDRAGAQDVELIYVLIPNVTTVYPEIFPEDVIEEKPYTTVYEQILATLGKTQATVVDMRPIYESLKDDASVQETYGGIYRVTDSSLTDYGAYLAYNEIMKIVSVNFPDAAPRTLDEFDWTNVTAKGGNLVNYRELSGDVITEDIVVASPKFSMKLGSNSTGSTSIASFRKFVDVEDNDYNFFIDINSADGNNGIAERWLIDTAREDVDLPNAIIYRDYGSLAFSDILVERFEKTLLVASGEHTINLSAAGQYAAEGKNAVDYIIVIVSEENMDTAFSGAFAN